MPFPQFDRQQLLLKPLAQRQHDMTVDHLLHVLPEEGTWEHPALAILAERIVAARRHGAAVILMMGAHVLRAGVGPYLIEMMRHGWVTHIAMNGAGPIHDWELALIGATTESVARYIRTGEFGLWEETGRINEAIVAGVAQGLGLGEAIGQAILHGPFPYKDKSVLAAAARLQVPLTVHVGIGYDIIHEHPNCDGAALGLASYRDFLIFAESVRRLEQGVLLNCGSAVMGPEVYLKALAMARNVAHRRGERICHITTAVFDVLPLEADWRQEAPRHDPRYYYRPWKTILVRTVADGAESFYIQGHHRQTLPALYWHVHRRSGRD